MSTFRGEKKTYKLTGPSALMASGSGSLILHRNRQEENRDKYKYFQALAKNVYFQILKDLRSRRAESYGVLFCSEGT